ncbi:MAG: HD domain-containing protein [Firmicutes bacterium]|nr:HD domain-containing protein [Bacillota bacterium]
MEKQFVANLQVGDAVHSYFIVTEKTLLPFNQPNRAGERYLRLQLADASGSMRAVIWEKAEEMAEIFSVGDVIRVRGEVTNFRGLQLTVYSLELVPEAEIERSHLQKTASLNQEELLRRLQALYRQITDPYLQKLLQSFYADDVFLKRYLEAPAARSVHHNYVGGLVEHSLEVAALCQEFAKIHPGLDSSLLICGALLHDVGKIEEYEMKGLSIELTTRGKLLGHIIIGVEMINEHISQIDGFPEKLQLELNHMILSHHGQKEWGSPEVPRTFAAFALFHADLVSARLNQFALAVEKGAKADGWTEWNRLLERDIYLGLAE